MWWFFLAGSLAGVVLGIAAAAAGLRWLQGARERRALQALITQVHLKQALAEKGPGSAESGMDPVRCRSSVIDIRLQVRETLSELRPGSSASANALLEMHRACDTYLNATDRPGGSVDARLRDLRLVLNQGARRLSSGRHVQYLAPGERAAVRREMLVAAARAKTSGAGSGRAKTGSAKTEQCDPRTVSRTHTDSPVPVPGPRRAALLEAERRSAAASAHEPRARRIIDHSDARVPL